MAFEHVSEYAEQIYRCNTCARCTIGPWDPWQPRALPTPTRECPIYETNKVLSSSAHGMILIIRELLEGKLQASDALVADTYQCLLCQGCNAVCEGNPIIPLGSLECAQIFRALRADLVNMGVAPPPSVKKVTKLIKEKHNRLGTGRDRSEWAKAMNIPTQGNTMIFAGCTAAYQHPNVVRSLAKVMKTAGMDFGILRDEWCCGAVQIDAGMLDDFSVMAKHNVDAIRKTGAKEIVTACADCYRTIKQDYPRVMGDLGFNVLHTSELISRLLKEKKIKLDKKIDLGGKVTYSDPCLLARGCNIIDQPRQVIKAIPGIEVVEMEGFGKYTNCCGRPIMASGSRDTFVKAGGDRVNDALAVGAKTVITGCVNCKQSLTGATRKGGANIKVMDITELISQVASA